MQEDMRQPVGRGANKSFTCYTCNKNFTRLADLKRHLNIHAGTQQKYICIICHSEFKNKCSLTTHLRKKSGCITKHLKGAYILCSICTCSFTTLSGFKKHFKTLGCRGSERFVCSICNVAFSESGHLKTHQKVHAGRPLKYTCCNCNAEFTSKCSLDYHLRENLYCKEKCSKGISNPSVISERSFANQGFRDRTKPKGCGVKERFPCNICTETFRESSHLKTHQETHVGKEPKYICVTCSAEFFSKCCLRGHRKKNSNCKHNLLKGVGSVCSSCRCSFTERKDFRKHIGTIGCRGKEMFPCYNCSKCFSSLPDLMRHQETHAGTLQSYICVICNASFASKCSLIGHLREKLNCQGKRPNGIRSICGICRCSFEKREDFRNHIKTVGCGGNERFPCDICNMTFSSTNLLRSHQVTHSSERWKHSCNTCNAKFAWMSHLKLHKGNCIGKPNRLNSVVKYTCSVCNSSFNKLSNLSNHIKTVKCGNECVTVPAQSVIPLTDISTSSSSLIRSRDNVSPSISSHDTFRVYVFKNTNSIDFPTFVSSKLNDIKKTISSEMKCLFNEDLKALSEAGGVECIEIEGKSEREVIETFGTHRSQFIPILNSLDIDNAVTHMLNEALYSYKSGDGRL